MSIQMFLILLLAVSVLTSLTVEATKKMFKGCKISWHANFLSAIVSTVLSIGGSIGYIFYTSTPVTVQTVILIIALVFLSWLCAMLGYDKVSQAINQIKNGGKTK